MLPLTTDSVTVEPVLDSDCVAEELEENSGGVFVFVLVLPEVVEVGVPNPALFDEALDGLDGIADELGTNGEVGTVVISVSVVSSWQPHLWCLCRRLRLHSHSSQSSSLSSLQSLSQSSLQSFSQSSSQCLWHPLSQSSQSLSHPLSHSLSQSSSHSS